MTKIVGSKSDDDDARERMSRHPLLSATPAQIDAWIDNNVTDLASAKQALKVLAKAVSLGARRRFN